MWLISSLRGIFGNELLVVFIQIFGRECLIMTKEVDQAWMVTDAQQHIFNNIDSQFFIGKVSSEELLDHQDTVFIAEVVELIRFTNGETLRS